MLYATEKRRAVTAILLVFMFIFAELLVANNDYTEMEEMEEDYYTVTQPSIATETHISSDFSSINYQTSTHSFIGLDSVGNEDRSLYRFTNSFNKQTDMIHSAELVLTCDVLYQQDSSVLPKLFPATIISNIAPSEVTWNEIANGVSWQVPGINGHNDRTVWDVPSQATLLSGNTFEFTFNVTKLAQKSLDLNRNKFDIVISGLGGQIQCAKSSNSTSTYHPSLSISHSLGVHGNGGTVDSNFAVNGMPLMTGNFLPTPNINPTISYEDLVGSNVEFQISKSNDFRNISDLSWLYSTIENSFTISGSSGSYTIPSTDSLPVGKVIHYRYRCLDSTSKLSDWSTGTFLLPSFTTVDNNDGTATITLKNDDFILEGYNLIGDTYLDSTLTQPKGYEQSIIVSNTPTSRAISHFKINAHLLGINKNATIVSAELNLSKLSSTSSEPMLSLHKYDGGQWDEGEATWNFAYIGQSWTSGGLNQILASEQTNITSTNANNLYSLNLKNSLQSHISDNVEGSINYVLTGHLPNDDYPSSTEHISFASSDYVVTNGANDIRPEISITFSLSGNNSSQKPSLISPINGESSWEIINDNITGDVTPSLIIESDSSLPMNYVIQLSKDPLFREVLLTEDSIVMNSNPSVNYNYTINSVDSLDKGVLYHWRVKNIDNDGRESSWNQSEFFVSNIASEWLGNNLFRFVLNASVEANSEIYPKFKYSSLTSSSPNTNSYGFPYMVASNSQGQGVTKAILGLDLANYLLPDGYAVISSNLTLNSRVLSGAPEVGVWELNNHEWNEQEVTWLDYSNNNPWNGPGLSGIGDKIGLLETNVLQTTGDETWNITAAVQNSMRTGNSLDLSIETISGQSGVSAQFYSHRSAVLNLQPQIEITFTIGSNQLPSPPSALSPYNGEWLFNNNSSLDAQNKPTIEWSYNNQTPVIGWVFEIDTSSDFSTSNRQEKTSWNDIGFDVINHTYELQTDLEIGEKWYWRVRGLSSTFQLGHWSSNFHFYLPDLDYNQISSDRFSTEYSHGSIIPEISMPQFVDVSITDDSVELEPLINHPFLDVGINSNGYNSSILINVPLPLDLQSTNATIVSANLEMTSSGLSTIGLPLSIREVYLPWTTDLSNLRYNLTDSWSSYGGRGIGSDIGPPLDIQQSVVGPMEWNITQLAQQAMANGQDRISLMIYTDAQFGDMVYFKSSDSTTDLPKLNLTWEVGSKTIPNDYPEIDSPVPGQIYFDQDSHALLPDLRPTFQWSIPSSSTSNFDTWIIYIDLDMNDDMAGQMVFNSKDNGSLFDLTNLTFTPDIDIDFDNTIQWYVQGIQDEMFGMISNKSNYYIPNTLGQELSPTDASLIIQDGTIFPPTNYPLATIDSYLDEGLPFSTNNGIGLSIGNSSLLNNNNTSSTTLVEFDLNKVALPTNIEILSAELSLNAVSGAGVVDISVSRMLTQWDENSTWDNSSAGIAWNESGALRGPDSDLPDSLIRVSSIGEYTWNVTRILQLAIESRTNIASMILQPEIIYSPLGVVNGNYIFADSENIDNSLRPKLLLNYRITEQWLPGSPSQLTPDDGETLWDENTVNLSGPSTIDFDFQSSLNNVTSWNICHGKELRWLECNSSSELGTGFIWDSNQKQFQLTNESLIYTESGDEWQYWRIRADQGHRIGHYSDVQKYRVPTNQSIFDGQNNYSVEFTRSSIFNLTGVLPMVSDASYDSLTNSNYGTSKILGLGVNPMTGGDSEIFLNFNLTDISFDSNIMPTSMILELGLASSPVNNNPMTMAIFACETFNESSLTYSNQPNCSSNELTRTTLSSSLTNTMTWDITNLAQYNLLNNNHTFSFKISVIGTNSNFVEFNSSENQEINPPSLKLTYIDNILGLTPPNQPTLVQPVDRQIVYVNSNDLISSPNFVNLHWAAQLDATAYKLFIKNDGNTISFDSRYDAEIVGTTFNSTLFQPGEVYEWWVQAFNQYVPGPSSPRWSFGLGSPSHSYNSDGTYTYIIKDSVEIEDYSHVDVRDTTIIESLALANYGTDSKITVGEGCLGVQNSVCAGIISVDLSQIPFDTQTQTLHSINLTFVVDSWDLSGGAFAVEFSVHQFLLANWNENILSWNTTGAVPGPVAGVDYVSTPIDVQTYTYLDQNLTFQVATDGMILSDEISLIIIGNPISSGGNFDGFVSLHSSDSSERKSRPKFEVTHTNVSTLNITTSSTSFNADSSYTFEIQSYDSNGDPINGFLPIGAEISWSSTTGQITNSGLNQAILSPTTNGPQTITACYGIICTDYLVNVESGLPVQILASLSQTTDIDYITITADETVSISAYALDQHGNIVTNEIINFLVSNGTISPMNTFNPYTVGNQTITAEWIGPTNSIQELLYVDVTPGAPSQVSLHGCDEVINAGESCLLYASAFDQYQNVVWFDDVDSFTISVEDGETVSFPILTPHSVPPQTNVLIGEYTGNLVGQWDVTLTTNSNLMDNIIVEVTHGAFAELELTASESTITADDLLYIDTTRIDVKGNRLAVNLPLENWTSIADGSITPGITATWEPNLQGTKSLTATYQGVSATVDVFVLRGKLSEINVYIDDEVANLETFSITTDEVITASLKAFDAKGNQWLIDGKWLLFHPTFADQSVLSSNYSQEITFSPTFASSLGYSINFEYQEEDTILSSNFVVYVSVGDIENLMVSAMDNFGEEYNQEDGFEITTDGHIQFQLSASDFDENPIDNHNAIWLLENIDTGELEEITSLINDRSLLWNPDLVGEWSISVYVVNDRGFNLSSQYIVKVSHGVPVMIDIVQATTTQNAGEFVDLQVTGTDSDGNKFAQPVVWFENGAIAENINSTSVEGIYEFNGRTAGNYTLLAEYLTVSSSVNIEVLSLKEPKNLKYNVSTEMLEQLETLTVTVKVYDEYWNQISVPDSARVDTTDSEGEVTYLGNGVWELETLDDGAHSATIVVGSITETFTYDVEGNLAGFFAAGGALYYVGAGLIGLIVVALLVFLVRLVRGDGEYYDDEDEEDDYSYEQDSKPAKDFTKTTISNTPVVPTPPTSPPSQQEEVAEEPENLEEEELSWAVDYRVEDDGTEWGQTDDEIWYYRESGSDDWVEWTE